MMPYSVHERYSRNPYAVSVLFACIFAGVVILITGEGPKSFSETISTVVTLAWATLLALGALVALVGIFWRSRVISWCLELGGSIMVSISLLIYLLILVSNNLTSQSAFTAILVLAITVAPACRVVQLAIRFEQWLNEVKSRQPQ